MYMREREREREREIYGTKTKSSSQFRLSGVYVEEGNTK